MQRAFFYGLIAAVAGVFLLLILRFASGVLTPFEFMLDVIVKLIPLNLFLLGIAAFGVWAKELLLIILVLLSIIAGGLLGMLWYWLKQHWSWLERRGPWWAAIAIGVILWVLAMVSLVPASGNGFFGLQAQSWPVTLIVGWLLASLAYALTFTALSLRSKVGPRLPRPIDYSRRQFLKRLAFAGAGLILAGGIGAIIWKIINSPLPVASGPAHLSPEITSNADFFIVSKDIITPQVDSVSWKLLVAGLVDRNLSLSYEQLKEFTPATIYLTLECNSNEVGGNLIGNAEWKGVRLGDILSSVKVKESVRKVVFYGSDDYFDSITPQQALADDVLLAYEMNGAPLLPEHGYPVRLLIPGVYGVKNVKWLNRIDLVDYNFIGYWERAGWSDQAVIKTTSRIDVPGLFSQFKPEESVMLGGIAFAGDRGISQVEVSVDGGKTWYKAELMPALSQYSWVIWIYNWTPAANGNYTLQVRATDGRGNLQTAMVTAALPEGATGYDRKIVVITANPSPGQP